MGDRQQRILAFIAETTRRRGYPPSVREIGQAVGLASSSTVQTHLNAMERRGLISRSATKARTVALTAALGDDATEAGLPVTVPVVGRVAAGSPILAAENIEDHLILSRSLATEGCFLLRVQGESMRDAGILSGDLVLVEPSSSPPDGTIVVAQIEDEATVKRLYREPDCFRLEPANPDYRPIRTRDLRVAGRVKALIRLIS